MLKRLVPFISLFSVSCILLCTYRKSLKIYVDNLILTMFGSIGIAMAEKKLAVKFTEESCKCIPEAEQESIF